MEKKNKIIVAMVIVIGIALALLGTAWFLDMSEDSTVATNPYKTMNLASMLKSGSFLKTTDEIGVTELGNIVNMDSKDKYELSLGYLDFGNKEADKVIISGVAAKQSGAILKMYLEGDKKPFIEMDIPEGNMDDKEEYDEYIYDIGAANLKGKKMLKMEVEFKEDAPNKTFIFQSIQFKNATIPTLYFDLDEQYGTIEDMNAKKTNSCKGDVTIAIPDGYAAEYADKLLENTTYQVEDIHGRGNSSWDAPKKPYTFKLSTKENLFGMGKAKKWILLANFYDKALVRDKLAYDLAIKLGMECTSKSVFVDIVMNNQYVGSYLLAEKVEVKKNRIEIEDLSDYPDETDENIISGGYLLELKPNDRIKGEPSIRTSINWASMVVDSPSFENGVNKEQLAYITDYYKKFEEALNSSKFCTKDGVPLEDLIDMDSFATFYIVHEVFKNNDALYASAYMYKDRGGKLFMGPVWDVDLSAGTYKCNGTERPEGFFIANQYIFNRLVKNADFVELVKEKYNNIHDDLVKMYSKDNKEGISDIRKYAALLDISQKMNFEKWGMGNRGWEAVLCQGSYEAEVKLLENWLKERIEWIDDNIDHLGLY